MSKLSNQLSMLFSAEISLNYFSFSQLLIAVKNLFDTEGIPGFVKALVILLETITHQSFRRASKNLNDTAGVVTPHTTLHSWFQK